MEAGLEKYRTRVPKCKEGFLKKAQIKQLMGGGAAPSQCSVYKFSHEEACQYTPSHLEAVSLPIS